MKRLGWSLVLCWLCLSCSKATKIDTQVLLLNAGAEPSVLNPILSTDSASSKIEGLIFSGLFRVNEDLELEPDLITTYNVQNGNKTYTFYLRKNVYWHDGQPFSAEDVKFTFEKILDPKTQTVRRSSFMIDGQPIKLKILDLHTIRIDLPKPFAPFLSRISTGILPKHILNKKDINKAAFNRAPIGLGPFVFKEWKTGQFVRLVRNANYYGKQPKLKEILFKIIPDANTALVALDKGELDRAGILAKDYEKYCKKKHLNIFKYYDLIYTYFAFNLKHKYFQDIRVRQAIAHAINKEAIIRGVLKGFGRVADIPTSPIFWVYPEEKEMVKYDYDAKKSKDLLKQAGFSFNKETQYFEKDGQLFSFTLITNKGNKYREKTAQIIQKYLQQIGIKMEIQLMEWSSFIKILNASDDPKKFEAVILAWSLALDPDNYSTWHSSQYPQGFNFIGYKNKKVDQLLKEGRLVLNKEKRKQIYRQAYQEIARDVGYIFLYYPESIVGVNKRVKGLSKPGPAGLFNRMEEVYLAK
jgi:peptide/nickel transport system substrate-binding protein